MASVKYGAIVTELKGKIGGQTFQGGYGGSGVVKNNPTNREPLGGPYNIRVAKKNALMKVSQSWRGLDDVVRNNWRTAAASFPQTNRFGITYTPSGYQIYCQFNIIRMLMGNSISVSIPSPATFPETVGWNLFA